MILHTIFATVNHRILTKFTLGNSGLFNVRPVLRAFAGSGTDQDQQEPADEMRLGGRKLLPKKSTSGHAVRGVQAGSSNQTFRHPSWEERQGLEESGGRMVVPFWHGFATMQ
jgi:hypothetical protein